MGFLMTRPFLAVVTSDTVGLGSGGVSDDEMVSAVVVFQWILQSIKVSYHRGVAKMFDICDHFDPSSALISSKALSAVFLNIT